MVERLNFVNDLQIMILFLFTRFQIMYKGRTFSASGGPEVFNKVLGEISEEGGIIQSMTSNKYYVFIAYDVPMVGGLHV
jgi:hypothetical protein